MKTLTSSADELTFSYFALFDNLKSISQILMQIYMIMYQIC